MKNAGPIIIVDDDLDGHFLFEEAMMSLGISNQLIFFDNGLAAYEYLCSDHQLPSLIICDLHMPLSSGIDFKAQVFDNPTIRSKRIPFLIFTSNITPHDLRHIYESVVQGIFIKEVDYKKFKDNLKLVIDYWTNCIPANLDKHNGGDTR
jgi:CheY-like chemotaxis protein